MSKLALPIAELRPALTGLGKVVAKRCTLPVLGHIKIERTKDGWIALTGTDLDTFVTVRLEQPGEGEPLSLLVPFDELQKITKNCDKKDNLLLAGDDKTVTIQYAIGSQVAETKVDSLSVEEYPPTPKVGGEPVAVNDALRHSIHEAMECASEDETRLILNSAYIDVSKPDGHYVIGTNGSHLFASNSFKLPLKECVIVPSHKFLGYREFNNDGEWQLRFTTPQHKDDTPWLQLSSRRWRFIGRQIEGAYPNWRQVVPGDSQYASTIHLDGEQADRLADTIEKLPEHDTINHTIGIERKDYSVSLLWKSDKEGDWQRLPVAVDQLKGNNITICLNRHYLIKALRFGLHRLDCIDAMLPMRFSHEGRLMIVMPVRAETVQYKPASPTQEATTPQPAATSPAAHEERKTMVNDTTNAPATATEPVTIEAQFDQLIEEVETMKTTMQDHLTGLKALGTKLKGIQREHKAGNKELHSIRQTLKGLQGVKL